MAGRSQPGTSDELAPLQAGSGQGRRCARLRTVADVCFGQGHNNVAPMNTPGSTITERDGIGRAVGRAQACKADRAERTAIGTMVRLAGWISLVAGILGARDAECGQPRRRLQGVCEGARLGDRREQLRSRSQIHHQDKQSPPQHQPDTSAIRVSGSSRDVEPRTFEDPRGRCDFGPQVNGAGEFQFWPR